MSRQNTHGIHYHNLEYSIADNISKIVLNRSPANALTREFVQELLDVYLASEKDEAVKVRYLTGNGRFFCTGLDIKEVDAENTNPIYLLMKEALNPLMYRMFWSAKPTVCAVNGPAVGAGASIAVAGDLTYAIQDSYLSFPFADLGLMPDALSSYYLPRMVGIKRARELLLTRRKILPEEAMRIGMINEFYPDNETLQSEAYAKALNIAQLDQDALEAIKKTLVVSIGGDFAEQGMLEEEVQRRLLQGTAFNRAVRAFQEKMRR